MAYSEDHIALAAEYALGTLDADERAQVETIMSVDKDFTAMVAAWEQKLAALNQMVGSVEPRPLVWDNIRIAIGHSEPQAPLLLPQAPSSAVAPVAAEPAAAVDTSNVIQLSGRIRRWRSVATFTTAIAAALVAMIAVQVFQPELLPDGIRPRPRTQVVEVKTLQLRSRRLLSMSPCCRRMAGRRRSFSRWMERPGTLPCARSARQQQIPARALSYG